MKYSELKALSAEDLRGQLKTAKEELFNLRFQLAIRQLDNTSKIGDVKHRIAQIQTALREQQLASAGGTK